MTQKVKGILYSQIGYDIRDIKRVIIRNSDGVEIYKDGLKLNIYDCSNGILVYQCNFKFWGKCWNTYWWVADFTDYNRSGKYWIEAVVTHEVVFEKQAIEIGKNIVLKKSYKKVAIEQFEKRAQLARNQKGWKDCGSDMREANSHCIAIIGLCDFEQMNYDDMTIEENIRIMKQIVVGCDYLTMLQKKAVQLGFPNGSIVHEVPNQMQVILGDVALFVVAMAKASSLLTEFDFDKSGEYLHCAEISMDYLLENPPIRTDGFNNWYHGAPKDYIPPRELMTRDINTMLWGACVLFSSGAVKYKDAIFKLAQGVIDRQIPKEESEEGYYGHFYTYPDKKFSEKAICHHHICMDTGGILPFYIEPFFEMIHMFPESTDGNKWKQLITNFGYGFFLPACNENPFHLMPMGYFAGEGILNFCGLWHGANVSIGYTAVLALRLEEFTGDYRFHEIAIGNLQWIAGLNAGITRESLGNGSCVRWKEDIEENLAVPMSQIEGVGNKYVRVWSRIPGAVANGFSRNVQFQFTMKPSKSSDEPKYFCDEDWIPHGSGFLKALAMLRIKRSWSPFFWEE